MRIALIMLLLILAGTTVRSQTAAGPPTTYGDATRWYQRAANGGSAKAQYLLAYMLETGKGRARDVAAAAQWYRRAAVQGHALAQFRLGWMRQNGLGVERDLAQAASWYVSAAAKGVGEAAFNLGYLYETGEGVAADAEKARIYYRQAAEKGLGGAQMNLGLLLAAQVEKSQGQGDTARSEGFLWLSLAAAQDVPDAAAARDTLGASLTPRQIEAIRKRIGERGKAGDKAR